jgi:hypothetical protein
MSHDKFGRDRFLCGRNICKVGQHICDESTSTCYKPQDMVIRGVIPDNVPRVDVDPETGEVFNSYLYSSHSMGKYSASPAHAGKNTASTFPYADTEDKNFVSTSSTDATHFTFCIPNMQDVTVMSRIESMVNHDTTKTISIVTDCGDRFVQRTCKDPFDDVFTLKVRKDQAQNFDALVKGRQNFTCASLPA